MWNIAVTSLVEVWIEIGAGASEQVVRIVTSLVEVWIEIFVKLQQRLVGAVTSLVEVWIEIGQAHIPLCPVLVTSLVEVWIEITTSRERCRPDGSLPSWKCGLKCDLLRVSRESGYCHFPRGSVD